VWEFILVFFLFLSFYFLFVSLVIPEDVSCSKAWSELPCVSAQGEADSRSKEGKNLPSTTGNPSGKGRDNLSPKK